MSRSTKHVKESKIQMGEHFRMTETELKEKLNAYKNELIQSADVNYNFQEIFDSFETEPIIALRKRQVSGIIYISTDPTYITLPDKNNYDRIEQIEQIVNTAKNQYNELISMLIYLKNTETSIKNHKLYVPDSHNELYQRRVNLTDIYIYPILSRVKSLRYILNDYSFIIAPTTNENLKKVQHKLEEHILSTNAFHDELQKVKTIKEDLLEEIEILVNEKEDILRDIMEGEKEKVKEQKESFKEFIEQQKELFKEFMKEEKEKIQNQQSELEILRKELEEEKEKLKEQRIQVVMERASLLAQKIGLSK